MGTTAQKGAYLNQTKMLLKDKINALGGSIDDETTFREYANQLDDIYEAHPKTEFEEGESVTLENTLKGKLDFQDNISGIGQAKQNSTQGYNLYYMNYNDDTRTWSNLNITSTKIGYSVRGTSNNSSGYTLTARYVTLPAGTYRLGLKKATTLPNVGLSTTSYSSIINIAKTNKLSNAFTLNAETNVCLTLSVTSGETYNEENEVMIYSGTDEKPFEQYTGEQASPSPSWKQEVKYVAGRNIVESKNVKSITTGYSDTLFAQAELKPNTTYTISFEGVEGNKIYSNENLFTLVYMTIPSGRASLVVTTKATISKNTRTQYQEENGGWVIFKNNGEGNPTANVFDNLQIEEGTQATPFKPFNTITETVSGENKFNLKGWINTLASQSNPIGSGTLDSYTDNSITITSTGNDCYTRSFTMGAATYNRELFLNNPDFFIEIEPSTEYTLSFVRSNASIPARPMIFYLDEEFNYLSLVDPGGLLIDKITNTTPSNAKYLTMRIGMINSSGQTLTISNIMYVKGTSTSYKPYITPKNYQLSLGDKKFYGIGNYRDTIRRSNGKNLFDKSKVINSYYVNAGTGELSGSTTAYNASDWIEVSPGDYVWGATSTTGYSLVIYDENKQYVRSVGRSIVQQIKVTIAEGEKYVRYTVSTADLDTQQFERGSLATDYEPYGVGVWFKYGKIGEKIFTGASDEAWTLQSINSYGIANFLNTSIDYKTDVGDTIGLCNYFEKQYSVIANTQKSGFLLNNQAYCYIRIESTIASTVEAFKTWLQTHNTQVIYVKATPTIDIITGTLAEQLEAWWNGQSLDGTTIIEGNGDLPMLINVRALKGAA